MQGSASVIQDSLTPTQMTSQKERFKALLQNLDATLGKSVPAVRTNGIGEKVYPLVRYRTDLDFLLKANFDDDDKWYEDKVTKLNRFNGSEARALNGLTERDAALFAFTLSQWADEKMREAQFADITGESRANTKLWLKKAFGNLEVALELFTDQQERDEGRDSWADRMRAMSAAQRPGGGGGGGKATSRYAPYNKKTKASFGVAICTEHASY